MMKFINLLDSKLLIMEITSPYLAMTQLLSFVFVCLVNDDFPSPTAGDMDEVVRASTLPVLL